MKVLAFDTAMQALSVAVVETDGHRSRTLAALLEPMARGHAEALAPRTRTLVDKALPGFDALDRIAVTVGPGTFTGVRIGVAFARGLALATGVPAVGVTTLEAIACNVAYGPAPAPAGPIMVVSDARRGRLYVQLFAPDLDPLGPPRLASLEDTLEALPQEPVVLAGTAAAAVAMALEESGDGRVSVFARGDQPDAAVFARLAAARPVPGAPPAPLYLRAPDARPQTAGEALRRRDG